MSTDETAPSTSTTAPNASLPQGLDDAALQGLLEAMFEFACTRPVRDYVDPARVLPALDAALEPTRTKRWLDRVFLPQRARLLELAKKSDVKLGAWLPDEAREGLLVLLGSPVRLPKKAVEEAVATERVRTEVRAMLIDTVQNVVAKATAGDAAGPGAAKSSIGLGAALGWGARAAGGMAKGLLGGLGEEVQKQLQQKAREYVDQSMAAVQARIAEKLTSDETAKALGQRRRAFAQKLFETPEREAAAAIERSKPEIFDPFVPTVIAHNLARRELREALEGELRAVFDELADSTVGSLLDDAGLRQQAHDALLAHGMPLARAFVSTEPFAAWWMKARSA